MYTIIIPR